MTTQNKPVVTINDSISEAQCALLDQLIATLTVTVPELHNYVLNERCSCGHAITAQSQRKLEKLDNLDELLSRLTSVSTKLTALRY